MCFFSRLTLTVAQLKERYHAEPDFDDEYQPNEVFNAFTFPKTPVITSKEPQKIQLFNWGLIPYWAKDEDIRKNTLNARFETIGEKPSFKYSINNRCIIPADGFYEWQWLDAKGNKKQKYLINLAENEPFAFAGLWSSWINKDKVPLMTYTIITLPANELMSEIHNSKKRMPFILSRENEKSWLDGCEVMPGDINLIAKAF